MINISDFNMKYICDTIRLTSICGLSFNVSFITYSNASGPPLIRGHGIRTHGASPSLDSGRGDSPESSCNSTLVLTPNTTQSKFFFHIIIISLLKKILFYLVLFSKP